MKKISVVEKFQFKTILFFCLALIAFDIIKLFRCEFLKQPIPTDSDTIFWLELGIGIILISMIMKLKYLEEKISVGSFGIALIVSALRNFVGLRLSLIISIFSQFAGLYFFWLSYSINIQNKIMRYKEKTTKNYFRRTKLKLILVLFLLLLIPFLFWLLGIEGKITRTVIFFPTQ